MSDIDMRLEIGMYAEFELKSLNKTAVGIILQVNLPRFAFDESWCFVKWIDGHPRTNQPVSTIVKILSEEEAVLDVLAYIGKEPVDRE